MSLFKKLKFNLFMRVVFIQVNHFPNFQVQKEIVFSEGIFFSEHAVFQSCSLISDTLFFLQSLLKIGC